MQVKFAKMHGLGNDFRRLRCCEIKMCKLNSEKIRWIADRKLGVGCDQVLVIHPATDADI